MTRVQRHDGGGGRSTHGIQNRGLTRVTLEQLEACHPTTNSKQRGVCGCCGTRSEEADSPQNVFVPEGKVPKLTVGGNTD